MKTKTVLMSSALLLTLYGCAGTGEPRVSALKVRPASNNFDTGISPGDLLYGDAVRAIDQRDYARALDLLQAARDKSPRDVRILNAFGVVYDKLGRFDLSQRYYAEAQAVEPASTIVAQNLAYSKALQGDSSAFALAEAPELKTAVSPPSIERASPRLAQAELRHDHPVIALASPAGPAAPAAAAVTPRPEPVRIVAPVPLAYASEPFVVRAASGARGASVKPLARPEFIATTPAQSAASPHPEARPLLAAAAARTQASPTLRAASAPAAVIPASAPALVASAPRVIDKASAHSTVALAAAPAKTPARVPAVAPATIVRVSAPALVTRAPRAMDQASIRTTVAAAVAPAKTPVRVSAVAPAKIVRVSAPAPTRTPVVAAHPPAAVGAARKAVLAPAARPPQPMVAKAPAPRAGGLLGRPVMVVYGGSGRRSADQLRAQLARRGWTLALANGRSAAPSVTTVRYAANSQRVAFALARSLRMPVRLEPCRARCLGVTILVGGQGAMRTATATNAPAARKIS